MKRMAVFALAALVGMGLVSQAYATTYYVATNGLDTNPGSQASPFKTVQHGIDVAIAGDIVHVKPGVFTERLNFPRSGTAALPITVEGEVGAVIDGSFPNFTPTWTTVPGYDGVYETPVPANTNCVTVDDQTITDLWWGYQDGIASYGCKPNDVFPSLQHQYYYSRMFTYGFANVPGLPDCTIWAGTPEGWDAVRGLALYIPGNPGKLWLKLKPGNTAPTVNITTHNVKIAPADDPIIVIHGASYITLRGLTIKNGYWGIDINNSTGSVIEKCILKPVFNGIRMMEGSDGIVIRYNEISMNHYSDVSTRSRAENVWAMSKFHLQVRFPYAADKVAVNMLNTVGNIRVHDNYIHDAACGVGSGWHGTPEEEAQYNTNLEVDHNLLMNNYQDAFGDGKNTFNHKWHHNVCINVLQAFRVFGVNFGPLYVYNNIWLDGPITSQEIVHFDYTDGLTPDVYFYNNTITDPSDRLYVGSSAYANNIFDPDGVGGPNYHYYNNLFYTDRFFKKINYGTEANWDGNYNVYAQRTAFKSDLGQAYATQQGIDLNSVWTTASPGFTNFAGGDVSLLSTSPARGAGRDLNAEFSAYNGGPLPGGYGPGYFPGAAPDAGALPYGTPMPVVPRTQDLAPLAPFISMATPASGFNSGGNTVTLIGSNFTGATGVSFGGTAATNIVVNYGGSVITCTAPVHAIGNVNVTVTTPAGTSKPVVYNYVNNISVTVNSVADSMVTPNAPTTNYGTSNNMQTKTTAGEQVWGILKFDMTSAQGSSITNAVLRVYKQANTTSHVITASSAANDTWTETGVNWNNKPAESAAQATKTVSTAGYYEWNITNYANAEFGGDKILTVYLSDKTTSGIWSQWYTKEGTQKPELVITTSTGATPAPILTSIAPSSGTTAGGTAVTLTGVNLTGATLSFGGTAGTNVVVNGAGTQITANSPAHAVGAVSVTATTPGGTSNGVSYTYTLPVPALTSITPSSGLPAGGTAVTIVGTNLTGTTNVSFGGTAATNVVVNGAGTQITATSPAHVAGAVNVTATAPGGTSNPVAFTYGTPAPTLTSITPNSGPTTGGTNVTIVGTNLAGATVSFGGTAATNVVVNGGGTQITATSPAKSAGAISVTATTAGGTSNGVTFTYVTGGAPFNVTLNPVADSMVGSGGPNTNLGTGNNVQTLMQWGNVWTWPILKFDMTAQAGTTITSAKLRVYKMANTASHVINVFSAASDSWTETGVTWNNKPAKDTSLATQTVANLGYYEWDVTSFVNAQFAGDKVVSFYMTDENNVNIWSQWYSREGTQKPQLVINGN